MIVGSKQGFIGGAYALRAVAFGGTSENAERGADLTGNANGAFGTFSCWLNFAAGGDGNFITLFENHTPRFQIRREDGGKFRISGGVTSLGDRLSLTSTPDVTSADGWVHIMASWDLDGTTNAQLYMNDVDILGSTTKTAGLLDYTRTNHLLGVATAGNYDFHGDMGQFYLNFGEYIDLTVEANRRKFIDADAKPVSLGSDGSLPTGTAPIMFFDLAQGEAVADFWTNKGSGGGFTGYGTLAEAATSPSD